MRALPGWSVMGVDQVLFELQVTVAEVELPISSTRARGAELLAPLALFQLGLGTTPATSAGAMGTSWPTKSMLMTLLEEVEALAVTLRVTVAEWTREPLVPVM